MPRDAATAININDLGVIRRPVPIGGALAGGIDGLMLNEQHAILAPRDDLRVLLTLARPGLAIRDPANAKVVRLDPHDYQANPAPASAIPARRRTAELRLWITALGPWSRRTLGGMGAPLERELGRGGDLLTSATARAAALARAREACKGVLAPSQVWRRPDGVVAVRFPAMPGASLVELGAAGSLGVGECVGIGVGVAEALAAMHAERLAHGDVSAANVMASGRTVALVDTMALAEERGTAGFVAPERTSGASPAADVFSLGMLLRFLANDEARPVIDAWTAPLLVSEPASRPTAAHAAAAIARCARAEPIRSLDAPVAASMRAGGLQRTVKTRRDRWWRAQKASVRLAPLAVLAVLAVISGTALVPAVAANRDALQEQAAAVEAPMTIPLSAPARESATVAAERLARSRIAALATGNGAALLALSAEGSQAQAGDVETAAKLDAGQLTFDGLELADTSAVVASATPGGAIVTVTTRLKPYSVGPERHEGGTATATLELVLTQRGWLVERILPRP